MRKFNSHRNIPDDNKVVKLFVTFSDGKEFAIPAEFVADHYASYYAEKYDEDYEKEKEAILHMPYELYDYMKGNLNWEDVEEVAELVNEREANYAEEFINADVSYGAERSEE